MHAGTHSASKNGSSGATHPSYIISSEKWMVIDWRIVYLKVT